jgi:hypothetical protein
MSENAAVVVIPPPTMSKLINGMVASNAVSQLTTWRL